MDQAASLGSANQIAPLKLPVMVPPLDHVQPATFYALYFNFTSDKFHDALARLESRSLRPEAWTFSCLVSWVLHTQRGHHTVLSGR